MSWIQLIPENRGGGSKRQPPGGRIGADGQLTINHNAADLLGEPDRVLIYAAEHQPVLRLRPATPSDRGAWTLTGGGGTQNRTKIITLVRNRPDLVGPYTATLLADGLHLVQVGHQVDTTNLTWRQLMPSASQHNAGGPRHTPAQLLPNGALVLNGKPVELLGTPAQILIFAETQIPAFRLEPATAADPNAWSLSGAGTIQRRTTLTTFIKDHPTMAGEYEFNRAAHGIMLRRKP